MTAKSFGKLHDLALKSLHMLAVVMAAQHKFLEAEALYTECWTSRKEAHGPRHPSTLRTMNNLATCMAELNMIAEAESLMRDCVELAESSTAVSEDLLANFKGNLGILICGLKSSHSKSLGKKYIMDALKVLFETHKYSDNHPWILKFTLILRKEAVLNRPKSTDSVRESRKSSSFLREVSSIHA